MVNFSTEIGIPADRHDVALIKTTINGDFFQHPKIINLQIYMIYMIYAIDNKHMSIIYSSKYTTTNRWDFFRIAGGVHPTSRNSNGHSFMVIHTIPSGK